MAYFEVVSLFNRLLKKKRYINKLDENKLPKYIAIIMDGNGQMGKKKRSS